MDYSIPRLVECMQNYLRGSLDLTSGSIIQFKAIYLEKEHYIFGLDVLRSNPFDEESMWISKTSGFSTQ